MAALHITPSFKALPEHLSATSWHLALERAARGWSFPEIDCTSLVIQVAAPASHRVVTEDGLSVVVFRQERWCHNERCDAKTTFPLGTMGMTETYPFGATGADVREADIELNAVQFEFTQGVKTAALADKRVVSKPIVSLDAVLLHELGHAVGLRDACASDSPRRPPASESCTDDARSSVMFAPALHEALAPADIRRVCELYPRREDAVSSAPRATPLRVVADAPPRSWSLRDAVGPATAPLLVLGVLGFAVAWKRLLRHRGGRVAR